MLFKIYLNKVFGLVIDKRNQFFSFGRLLVIAMNTDMINRVAITIMNFVILPMCGGNPPRKRLH